MSNEQNDTNIQEETPQEIKAMFISAIDRADLGGLIGSVGSDIGDLIASVDKSMNHGAKKSKLEKLIDIANDGDLQAMRILSQLYQQGVVVKQSSEQADMWSRKYIECIHLDEFDTYDKENKFFWARRCHDLFKDIDLDKSFSLYERLAKDGGVRENLELGSVYEEHEFYDQALKCYIESYNAYKNSPYKKSKAFGYSDKDFVIDSVDKIISVFSAGRPGIPKDENKVKEWKQNRKSISGSGFIAKIINEIVSKITQYL